MIVANNSQIEVLDHKCLFEGRVIVTLFTAKEFDIDKTVLVNLYALNGKRERCLFFKNLLKEIKSWKLTHNCNQLDHRRFNCVINPEHISKEYKVGSDESSNKLKELINQLNMADFRSKFNKGKTQYTW